MTMHILRIPSHPSHAPHPPHILRIPPHMLRIPPHMLRIPPHILRSAAYVRGYRDSVFQTHGGMGSLSSHPLHPPHILRSATYVRGYRDSVFQTHGGMWLSILASTASPRTYSAPLRMYGVTEIASSRRMGACGSLSSHPLHPPAHTTLRCVCTGLQR